MTHGVLPERIKSARQRAGLSQSEIAREIGLNQSSVSDWERGETAPSLANLTKLARLLGVTVDHLLDTEAA